MPSGDWSKTRHRRDSKGESKGESAKKKTSVRNISTYDLRVTFENMVHYTTGCRGNALDKRSVVECMRSVYDWVVTGSDAQLELPVAAGDKSVARMWPQGAVVDTRRKASSDANESSPTKLRDLDEEAVVNVARSVVSSAMDEEKPLKFGGKVFTDSPNDGGLYNSKVQYSPSSLRDRVGAGQPRAVPESVRHMPTATRRVVPRYSVLEATAPTRANETPDIAHAEPYVAKRGLKLRVGAVSRGDNEDEDGEQVLFED